MGRRRRFLRIWARGPASTCMREDADAFETTSLTALYHEDSRFLTGPRFTRNPPFAAITLRSASWIIFDRKIRTRARIYCARSSDRKLFVDFRKGDSIARVRREYVLQSFLRNTRCRREDPSRIVIPCFQLSLCSRMAPASMRFCGGYCAGFSGIFYSRSWRWQIRIFFDVIYQTCNCKLSIR